MNKVSHELIETFERLTVFPDGMLDTAKTKQQYLISGNIEGRSSAPLSRQTEIAMLLENKGRIYWKDTAKDAILKIKLPYIL